MTSPRITPERLDELLVEYGIAMQELATTSALSLAPDKSERIEQWRAKATALKREISEGVFP